MYCIYYNDGALRKLVDNMGNVFMTPDLNYVFQVAKQFAKSHMNYIVSIVEEETGAIVIDFQLC